MINNFRSFTQIKPSKLLKFRNPNRREQIRHGDANVFANVEES